MKTIHPSFWQLSLFKTKKSIAGSRAAVSQKGDPQKEKENLLMELQKSEKV